MFHSRGKVGKWLLSPIYFKVLLKVNSWRHLSWLGVASFLHKQLLIVDAYSGVAQLMEQNQISSFKCYKIH